ncbi:acetyltransferase GNAT family protein [Variibacter gotjawalensis]|uniref:Acetyltransferase GNAT family protein n=1 Tax=Variibacter gotjawalensis TaxID=1333996 RepID=A0A0S3PUD8_9BRAD|nr:MSMEG_0567/Sll0786 family nitrogen starvation N-acetyltransferase [Variibacter gotjawalensis]NIK49893.1 putative N-acetyltransferase (TIGR04045 family) [Variibacter gotjawalensis]RZS45892.1 putative N-acetyltransferase (TIGR04045 family) [Variibacter gotjawalensis]BAT59567.1 acetyltransferase GNAT family protein [Variibacter gotjawalensis]
MIFEPVPQFLAPEFMIKFAVDDWEREAAAALRRQVFCAEQKVFERDDRDETDNIAIPLVALSMLGVAAGDVVGTVRIHPDVDEADVWWGSRLAVERSYRKLGAIGSGLIRLAVSSARARGCKRFLANVQSQNALMFQHLHWRSLGEFDYCGRPHHRMEAELDHYPPFLTPEIGFHALPKMAA